MRAATRPGLASEGRGDRPGEGAEAGSLLASFSLTCAGTSQATLHPGGPTLASAHAPRLRSAGEAGQRESVCETRTEGVPSPPATSQVQPGSFKSFPTQRLSGNVQVFLIAHIPARQVKQTQFLLYEEETKAREGC